MVAAPLNAVEVLEQRLEFLEGIKDIVIQCNWSSRDVQDLYDCVLEEVIKIDNLMFYVYEETKDPNIACLLWERRVEELRYWLQLIIGVKVKFI